MAYTWTNVLPGATKANEQETQSRLVVCDPSRRNAQKLATEKGKGRYLVTLGGVQWR